MADYNFYYLSFDNIKFIHTNGALLFQISLVTVAYQFQCHFHYWSLEFSNQNAAFDRTPTKIFFSVRAESGARVQLAEVRRVEDDEFDEEDLVPDTKSKNQENRNCSQRIQPIDAIA